MSWETAYHRLSHSDEQAIRLILPAALERNRQVAEDLQERIDNLKSALQLNGLVAKKSIAAAVSLHLSSHGNAVGSVDNGWLYQLNPAVNRAKQFTHLRPLLSQAAEGQEFGYLDLLGGNGRKQWFNHFPDQPALGGEVTALAGMPGFTLASLNDMRSRWGTPYDTADHLDAAKVVRQSELIRTMLLSLGSAKLPAPPYKAVNGFVTLAGQANFLRQGELFAEQPAGDVLLQVYQDQQYSLAWIDSLGTIPRAGTCRQEALLRQGDHRRLPFRPGKQYRQLGHRQNRHRQGSLPGQAESRPGGNRPDHVRLQPDHPVSAARCP